MESNSHRSKGCLGVVTFRLLVWWQSKVSGSDLGELERWVGIGLRVNHTQYDLCPESKEVHEGFQKRCRRH